MSFKTILVHVDDSPQRGACMETAFHITRSFQARLVGLYLAKDVDFSSSVATMLPPEVVSARVREAQDAENAARNAFKAAAANMRLERVEWRAPEGDLLEAALAHARCADL